MTIASFLKDEVFASLNRRDERSEKSKLRNKTNELDSTNNCRRDVKSYCIDNKV